MGKLYCESKDVYYNGNYFRCRKRRVCKLKFENNRTSKTMLKVVGASWVQTRVSWWILIGILLFGILSFYFGTIPRPEDDGKYSATVFWFSGTKRFDIQFWGQNNEPSEIRQGAARAYYQPDMYKTGWAVLEIETNETYPDYVQAFASGMLEGSLSWLHIYWQWQNMVEQTCEGREEFCDYVREFLDNNTNAIRAKASSLDKINSFWHQVNLFYIQLDGLEYGWKFEVGRNREDFEIPYLDFLWMNIMPDLKDFEKLMNASRGYNPERPSVSMALLKLLPTNGTHQFLLAHASSAMYSSMLRIQKKYTFGFHKTGAEDSDLVTGRNIRFTSYPGSIHSQDDFYQILLTNGYRATITGTTIHNYNHTKWDLVNSETQVLLGPRVMAGNRLATDGESWSNIVEMYNSGTGNKQWLHVLHHPKNKRKTTLWVMEQMPGQTKNTNETETFLRQSYWISCGIPYYPEIRNSTQNEEIAGVKYSFSFYHMPILHVLRIGQRNISDIESLLNLMRGPDLSLVGRSDLYEDVIPSSHLNSTEGFYNNFTRYLYTNESSHPILKLITSYYIDQYVGILKGNASVHNAGKNYSANDRIDSANNFAETNLGSFNSSGHGVNSTKYRTLRYLKGKHAQNNTEEYTSSNYNVNYTKSSKSISNHSKYVNVEYKALNNFFLEYSLPLNRIIKLKTIVSLYNPSAMSDVYTKRNTEEMFLSGEKSRTTLPYGRFSNPTELKSIESDGPNDQFLRSDFDGVIDLKITHSTLDFQAIAGPPFTAKNSIKNVAPFQWSKSRINHLPHYGHSDIWNYTPVNARWVWN